MAGGVAGRTLATAGRTARPIERAGTRGKSGGKWKRRDAWEYFVHTIDVGGLFSTGNIDAREMQNALNWYGRQGWELVSTFDTSSGRGGSRFVVLTFKRPLAVVPPPPPVAQDAGG